jgi:hypothetical protein
MNTHIEFMIGIGGGALALLGMICVACSMRALRDARARCAAVESSVAALRRELELLVSISVKTGRMVKRIEHDYSGVAERVDQVELRGPAQSFDQAIDSARRDADPVKLERQFGLSRGEADLVMRLHGRRKSA